MEREGAAIHAATRTIATETTVAFAHRRQTPFHQSLVEDLLSRSLLIERILLRPRSGLPDHVIDSHLNLRSR